MIFTRMYGGMGNQMFQYAFSRKLQTKYDGLLYLDVSEGTEFATTKSDQHRESILSEFSLPKDNICFVTNKEEFDKRAGRDMKKADVLDMLPRVVRKVTKNNTLYRNLVRGIQNNYNPKGFFTAYDCYSDPSYPDRLAKAYVNGLFSSKLYFDDIKDVLQCEFEPRHEPSEVNQTFLRKIREDISVCVHVRKGSSYINNPYLNVCSGDYFEKAMDWINGILPNAVFYIFSNDFNWCEENLSLGKHKCVIVNVNDGQHAVDELRLMKACKHFILSNSTMGWWAQYLCANEQKIVVSPSSWTKGKIDLLGDLIEQDWHLIKV